MKGASFTNFRGEYGVLISSNIKNGEVEYIKLETENECTYKIVNVFASDKLLIKTTSFEQAVTCEIGNTFEVCVKKGEQYIINMSSEKLKSNYKG